MEPGRKVLILDEDIMTVMEIEEYLETGGYDVVHLSSPSGAISKIEYEDPEVLLLDIEMNRLNLDDLLSTIQQGPEYEEMVVVAFSDMEADELQQFCMDNGLNGYFCKSMDVSQIAEFLDNFFEY